MFLAMHWAEYIGFAGVAIVLGSFIITGEKKIRIVNIIGCTINLIYAIIVQALIPDASMVSVIILNGALIPIHIFNLIKSEMNKRKNQKKSQGDDIDE
ncbi:hypothetical protein LJC17_01795 [Acholeplasma sp. OttesenSCG-928-E16]|nr:hypothetical protein [Acholeplasma sp. OttesenSCG-928-E16]